MTQLVKKDSSWRTLRRKAVVGASSFALVAGMGVALAPVASAAVGSPTVSITAPDAISNDGSSAADIKVTVKTASGNAADSLPNSTSYRLSLTVPTGIKCSDVKLTATLGGTAAPTFSAAAAAGTAPNCTFDSTAAAAVDATVNPEVDWTFKVTIAGHTAATPFDPAVDITGEVGIKFEVAGYETGAPIVSATATTELVAAGPATMAESVAVPKFGTVYNETVVKTAGFPDAATSYTVIQSTQKTDGTWNTAAQTRVSTTGTDVVVVGTTTPAPTYMSLNDSNVPSSGNTSTGFYLNTVSGKVVFGTLTNNGSAATNTFVAKAVNARGGSTGLWTVLAANTNWSTTGSAADPKTGAPTVPAKSVASKLISLNVGFSDVADDNVFADAINSLATAGVIKGNADGTFGYKDKVTRAEFAAFAFRTLVATGDITTGTSGNAYVCSNDNTSNFSDVSNFNVFCDEVNTLAKLGVVNGTGNGKFAPNAQITRDQIAAFIYRMNAVGLGNDVTDAAVADTQFTDVTKANIFSGDIAWGAGTGIINGRTATIFDPAANVLRQEAAGLLYRFGHNQFGIF